MVNILVDNDVPFGDGCGCICPTPSSVSTTRTTCIHHSALAWLTMVNQLGSRRNKKTPDILEGFTVPRERLELSQR